MFDALRNRLVDQIAELPASRVEGAIEFAELIQKGAVPAAPFFAYIIPSGQRGLQTNAMAGAFQQGLAKSVTIFLGFRANGVTATAKLDDIDNKITAVLHAVAGWSPPNEGSVFQIVAGTMAGFNKGAFFYELQFSINHQLEVFS